MPPRDDKPRGSMPLGWFRGYALVFEFLAYLGVLGYLGWWLDERYLWEPWGLFGGLLAGLGFGLFRMIREFNRLEL